MVIGLMATTSRSLNIIYEVNQIMFKLSFIVFTILYLYCSVFRL